MALAAILLIFTIWLHGQEETDLVEQDRLENEIGINLYNSITMETQWIDLEKYDQAKKGISLFFKKDFENAMIRTEIGYWHADVNFIESGNIPTEVTGNAKLSA